MLEKVDAASVLWHFFFREMERKRALLTQTEYCRGCSEDFNQECPIPPQPHDRYSLSLIVIIE